MIEISKAKKVRLEDLDEASIYFYRLWSMALLKEQVQALVILQPEYIVVGNTWTLYASKESIDKHKLKAVEFDTGNPTIAIAPYLPDESLGISLTTGQYSGSDDQLKIIEAFLKAALNLPEPAIKRDPNHGRWHSKAHGEFEIWKGGQSRLLCKSEINQEQFGYTWAPSSKGLYFFKSKSCKREGKLVSKGIFKLSERLREGGRVYWNIDLLEKNERNAALLRLVPAGAGYKIFLRQMPTPFIPIEELR